MNSSLTVLMFARYADVLGADRFEVPMSAAATIGDLVTYVRGLPGGTTLPFRPFVAVNLAQVEMDYVPKPGDEIAFLPPMAGG
ncbi:MAG: MoaD/ThiS family protein [Gemmatimonadales bacterium]